MNSGIFKQFDGGVKGKNIEDPSTSSIQAEVRRQRSEVRMQMAESRGYINEY